MNCPCLEPLEPQKHIDALYTPLGAREVYESVAYCNRCGACMQVCPTYQLYAQEIFSPRGRNQLLLLALEGKIKLNAQDTLMLDALRTCTLCGRCNEVCAGQIPTAEHVLEMRRALHKKFLPKLLFLFLRLRTTRPDLFTRAARLSLTAKRFGVLGLLWLTQLTRVPALSFLNHLRRILPPAPRSLQYAFKKAGLTPDTDGVKQIYLPSLEAEFLLPQIACQTLAFAQQKARTAVWQNTPCGLFEYVYGDLRLCRRTVRRLLERWEQAGKLPLITDSIDVYYFLKRTAQLFAAHPALAQRARDFAAQVHFVTDILPEPKQTPWLVPVQLEDGALFERNSEATQKARQFLFAFFGKNLVECCYTDADVPAFGYSFVAGQEAARIGKKAVEKWARTSTRSVVVLSGLAALETAYLLRKFYPQAKAVHLVEVAQNR